MRNVLLFEGRRVPRGQRPFRQRSGTWRIVSPRGKQVYLAKCRRTEKQGGKHVRALFEIAQ